MSSIATWAAYTFAVLWVGSVFYLLGDLAGRLAARKVKAMVRRVMGRRAAAAKAGDARAPIVVRAVQLRGGLRHGLVLPMAEPLVDALSLPVVMSGGMIAFERYWRTDYDENGTVIYREDSEVRATQALIKEVRP